MAERNRPLNPTCLARLEEIHKAIAIRIANHITLRGMKHREASVIPSHLIELGQRALADVTTNVARGAPIVRCQLLASEFYEALKRELRATSELGVVERAMVVAAANQCRHAATASISPGAMLVKLRNAMALLQSSGQIPLPAGFRPMLRVIEGGLSR